MNVPLHSRWFSLLLHGIAAAILAGCLIAFRTDLASIPLDVLPAAADAIALTAALSLANYALRAWRWRLYFYRIGYPLPATYAALTYVAGFAFTLSPGKVGELVRAGYYRQRGVPLAAVTAVFFTERLTDLAVMVALAAIFLAGGAGSYAPLLWIAGLCIPVALISLAMLRTEFLQRVELYLADRAGWLACIGHLVLHSLDSARALMVPRIMLAGFLVGAMAWGAEGVGLYVLGTLVPDVSLGLQDAVGIYAIAIIVGALSFLPGGLGTAEAAMVALLMHHGYALPQALLVTLVCRILTLWLAIGLGWLAVAMLKLRGERVMP